MIRQRRDVADDHVHDFSGHNVGRTRGVDDDELLEDLGEARVVSAELLEELERALALAGVKHLRGCVQIDDEVRLGVGARE
jgi:hypothetical protein